jgi:serine/threonine protein kinase/DNA-binding response OmpR family regulator
MDPTSANFTLSREVLLQNLLASRLLSPEELEQIASGPHPGSVGLANALVESGLLTAYQIDAIGAGRHDELRVGNYDILGKLGAGGMGTVFQARHRRLKRIVALKVLSADLCQDIAFVRRFQREAETVARLSHPNIVMAYDADEAEVGHFLVMEFVNGRDLASTVEKNGPLSVFQAIDCTLQAAKGLAYAHEQGIIHRDIKPHNLLLDQAGTLKITDLGLARLVTSSSQSPSSLTQAGGLLGTSNYMPPEQATDPTQIDHRADIYALGCTLHFILTGNPPFDGPSMMSVLIKHRETPAPSLTAQRPDVPADLDRLYLRMMAKEPSGRPKSMAEVAAALTPLRETASATAPVRPGHLAVSIGAATFTGEAIQNTLSEVKKAPSLTVLVVEPSRVQGGIIRKYLEAQDITVLGVVVNGQEALKSVRASAPVCIVSALHLPDMTGLDLAQAVRDEAQGNPPGFVLVSTASESATSSLTQISRALMLHKPFTPAQLIEAVNVVTGWSVKVKEASLDVTAITSTSRAAVAADALKAKKVVRSAMPILIVDDSAAARTHQRTVLQSLGFSQFREAADGAQAVAALSTALVPFGLIVTDYNMPLMDGKALLGYLKQTPMMADVPVIMVTSETDSQALAAIRALGVAGIFSKAFLAADVKAVLDKLF